MLLDRYMPRYHFTEVHGIAIRAPRDRVYRALLDVSIEDMPLARALFTLRSIPAILTGKGFRQSRRHAMPGETIIEQAIRGGFVKLGERPGRELVLGTIGRFWQASGGVYRFRDVEEFMSADAPTYAKSAINFLLYERDGLTKVRTETRILIPDRASRRKFAAYWTIVHPGSAVIRRVWLGAVKRRAEG
jgi:hypothetical protein